MATLGLFPLELVLLPGERVPLHIFEPRYKELVNECLSLGTEFGVLLADDAGVREVGTKAAIIDVLERLPDGRLNILVEGRERFRVVQNTGGRSFATAETADVVDEAGLPSEETVSSCLVAYQRLSEVAEVPLDELDPGSENLAFRIAATLTFSLESKQELLEMASENERLTRVRELLEIAAVGLHRRLVQQRASLNGQVKEP
jgi:Lon protease-like protein